MTTTTTTDTAIHWARRESDLGFCTLEVWTARDDTRYGTGARLTIDRRDNAGRYAWEVSGRAWSWSGSADTFDAAESRILEVLAYRNPA